MIRICLAGFGALVFLIFAGEFVIAQTSSDMALNERRFSFAITNKPFRDVITTYSREYNVPIGFEVTTEEEPPVCKKVGELSFNESTITDLMSSAVSLCPVYTWEVTDGVVHIFPIRREESILDLAVSTLAVKENSSEEILDKLFETKEVVGFLETRPVRRDTTSGFQKITGKGPQKFTISFSNRTVRDIMNYLVVSTDEKAWIFYYLKNDRGSFSLRFF